MRNYNNNPRQITKKQYDSLTDWLDEFGDLSGIVHDLNSDQIIGGNQRSSVFGITDRDIHSLLEEGRVAIIETYDTPTRTGTVAWGYITWNEERFMYRQVRWTAEKCERANLIANHAGGSDDWDILASKPPELLESTGFNTDMLQQHTEGYFALSEFIRSRNYGIGSPGQGGDNKETEKGKKNVVCPNCEFEFTPERQPRNGKSGQNRTDE